MVATTLIKPRALVVVLVIAFAWLGWAVGRPASLAVGASRPVADRLGPWTGKTLEVEPRALLVLGTEAVALMEYRLGEEPPVWLARVAGVGSRAAFHPPELCYIGSHFEVLERGAITVLVGGEPLRIMRLVIGQDDQRYEAWYWFTANGRVTPSYYRQQFWLVWDSVRGQAMSGTLMRISTPTADGVKSAHRRLLAFLTAFQTSEEEPASLRLARR